jgi:endo-1,3-1,4-beta-glycanase ExoK
MKKTMHKSFNFFTLALAVIVLLLLPMIACAEKHHNNEVPYWKGQNLPVSQSVNTNPSNGNGQNLPVSQSVNTYPVKGKLNWKGLDWYVYTGRSDPGNNYWNQQGVWIDNQNRLHLTIIKKDGKWYSTGIETVNKYTYGTFTWTVDSPVYTFDKNSVLGLFTYRDDNNELDIEPSQWGYAGDTNLGYTVQPFTKKGNEKTYRVAGDGAKTTYQIKWQPSYVKFSSVQNGKLVNEWSYTNAKGVPKTSQNACMNLWLINKPPSDGKNIECIISDFSITK